MQQTAGTAAETTSSKPNASRSSCSFLRRTSRTTSTASTSPWLPPTCRSPRSPIATCSFCFDPAADAPGPAWSCPGGCSQFAQDKLPADATQENWHGPGTDTDTRFARRSQYEYIYGGRPRRRPRRISSARASRPPGSLVGFGAGVKRTGDQPTGEKALVAMVQHKVSPDTLAQADLLPTSHEGVALDVVDVGQVFAGVGLAPLPPAPPAAEQPAPDRKVAAAPTPAGGSGLPALLNTHLRPAPGGWSVGHFAITAGTIGTCVYDILPGGSVHP